MTFPEAQILARGIAGPMRFREAKAAAGLDPDRTYEVLHRLWRLRVIEHVRYDHWAVTERGRIAIALHRAKEEIHDR